MTTVNAEYCDSEFHFAECLYTVLSYKTLNGCNLFCNPRKLVCLLKAVKK